ncbi:uncharacterized protein LOC111830616 [Capsella rubella]|uniref:uncharacterized protein LOC111830616 n=1 Tax=Capsella rubella TaxID=81985 RepID=UPI000CD54258|nr:uncharacterized protein LOC111830616 [Capsella rubella]
MERQEIPEDCGIRVRNVDASHRQTQGKFEPITYAQKKKEVDEKKRAEAEVRRKGNEEKGQPKKRGRKPRGVQQLKPSVPSDLVEELAEDVVKIPLVKFKFSKEGKKQVEVEDNKVDNKGDNKACDSEIEDVTDNNPFENLNVLPESDVDEEEKIRNERIKGLRRANVKFAKDGSALEPQPNPHVFPIIGENGLTCMRKNCVPSVAIYDPFAPVDPARLERLLEHLSPHKATPYGKAVPEIEFYKRLITERKDWPATDNKYGWLRDDHVSAFMRLLTKRFLEDPCPFHTKGIAFLDPWFMTMLPAILNALVPAEIRPHSKAMGLWRVLSQICGMPSTWC